MADSCSVLYLPAQIEVRLGEHMRSSTSETTITRDFGVEEAISHPGYEDYSNDIALVGAGSQLLLSSSSKVFCLWLILVFLQFLVQVPDLDFVPDIIWSQS